VSLFVRLFCLPLEEFKRLGGASIVCWIVVLLSLQRVSDSLRTTRWGSHLLTSIAKSTTTTNSRPQTSAYRNESMNESSCKPMGDRNNMNEDGCPLSSTISREDDPISSTKTPKREISLTGERPSRDIAEYILNCVTTRRGSDSTIVPSTKKSTLEALRAATSDATFTRLYANRKLVHRIFNSPLPSSDSSSKKSASFKEAIARLQKRLNIEKAANVAEAVFYDRKRRKYKKRLRCRDSILKRLSGSDLPNTPIECARLRYKWNSTRPHHKATSDMESVESCALLASNRSTV